MKIKDILSVNSILVEKAKLNKKQLLEKVAHLASEKTGIDEDIILNRIRKRKESFGSNSNLSRATEIDYYTNAQEVAPSMESLLSFGNNVNIKLSATLISTLIAFVIISILLIVYYRINAVAIIATTLGSLFTIGAAVFVFSGAFLEQNF